MLWGNAVRTARLIEDQRKVALTVTRMWPVGAATVTVYGRKTQRKRVSVSGCNNNQVEGQLFIGVILLLMKDGWVCNPGDPCLAKCLFHYLKL